MKKMGILAIGLFFIYGFKYIFETQGLSDLRIQDKFVYFIGLASIYYTIHKIVFSQLED